MSLKTIKKNQMVLLVRGSHWQGKKDLKEGFWLVEGTVVRMKLVVVAQLYLSFLNKHRQSFRIVVPGPRFKLYKGSHQLC